MKELLSLEFKLKRELFTTLRLTAGGVCSLIGLNMEESEDCKVCITEALLLLMHGGCRSARIGFFADNGIAVKIEGEECFVPVESYPDDEISSALLAALAEDVEMKKEDGSLRTVGFRFSADGR